MTNPRPHRAARALAAIAAWLALAALTAGIPAALFAVSGSPIPRALPSAHQVITALASRDNGTLFLAAVRAVTWIAWACFALSVLVEGVSRVRGRPAPRLPVIGPVQGLAAALIGAAILSAISLPHPPRPAPRLTRPAQVAMAGQPRPAGSFNVTTAALARGMPPPAAPAGAAGRPHYRLYEVVEGDDLWDIAGRFLHDPERWQQIFRLNEGRPQPDGRALAHPGLILPGWALLIPQAGGTGGTAPPAPPGRPGTPTPGPSRSPAPSPAPAHAGSNPRAAVPPAGAHPPAPPHRAAVHLPSGAIIGIAVAVMVAAAIVLAAVQRRRRYRPRLAASLRPAAPPAPPVITALRRAAMGEPAPGTVNGQAGDPYLDMYDDYLDMYDDPAEPHPQQSLPPFVPALAPRREAYTAAPSAPAARAAVREPRIPRERGMLPVGVRADGGESAVDLAALGGLGLAGPGAPAAARAVIAGLLAQAPAAQGGTPARVIIPAADAARLLPGADAAAVPGVSVPASLASALSEMEVSALAQARASDAAEDDDPGVPAGRPAGGPEPGSVLIAACTPGAEPRLRAILEAGRRQGTAAVLLGAWPAGTTCEVAADGTVTTVTPPRPALLGARLFTLGAAEATAITGVLADAAGQPSTRPQTDAGDPEPRPAGQAAAEPHTTTPGRQDPYLPAPAPAAEQAPAQPPETGTPAREPAGEQAGPRPVRVAVLGPLQVTADSAEISGGMRKARELLAFLAVHPDGATGEAVSEALWPEADARQAAAQRNLALRKARELLRAATGLATPMWIVHAAGRYRLDPALISTDLEEFQDAIGQARRAEDDGARLAACRAAVALYRGDLAEGAGYEWAEPQAETARRRALDAWTAIADILQPADPDQALSALEAALAHDPYNEYMYQKIMRLQAAAGRPEAVRRTLALLESRLAELGIAPGTQTRQVAASLLGAARPPGGPPGPGEQRQ